MGYTHPLFYFTGWVSIRLFDLTMLFLESHDAQVNEVYDLFVGRTPFIFTDIFEFVMQKVIIQSDREFFQWYTSFRL